MADKVLEVANRVLIKQTPHVYRVALMYYYPGTNHLLTGVLRHGSDIIMKQLAISGEMVWLSHMISYAMRKLSFSPPPCPAVPHLPPPVALDGIIPLMLTQPPLYVSTWM